MMMRRQSLVVPIGQQRVLTTRGAAPGRSGWVRFTLPATTAVGASAKPVSPRLAIVSQPVRSSVRPSGESRAT